jgi:hypothetical protein
MPVSFLVRILLWLWLGGAIAMGHFLVLQRLPPLAMPAVSVAIAGLLAVVCFRIRLFRTWVDSIDLRALVLLHTTRFIGIYFLSLSQRGEFPRALLSSAIADIIIAAMALPVAFAPLTEAARRRAIVIWNVVGFVGLLLALVTMARLNLSSPTELRAFTRLPLSLVPTLLLPLLLFIHVVIFVRTRGNQER